MTHVCCDLKQITKINRSLWEGNGKMIRREVGRERERCEKSKDAEKCENNATTYWEEKKINFTRTHTKKATIK